MPASTIDINNLDSSAGFMLFKHRYIDSLSSAGDINGDGLDDIAIGIASNNNQAGEVIVIYGSNTKGTQPLTESSINGVNGFKLTGNRQQNTSTWFPGEYFGSSVSGAGDVNGDGIDDLAIGSPYANLAINPKWNSPDTTGAAYIYYGNANGGTTSRSTYNGSVIGGNFGKSVSSAGDFNGDGKEEIIIGNPNAEINGKARAGQVHVGSSLILSGDSEYLSIGSSVGTAGDFNGDGLDDIVASGTRFAVVFGQAGGRRELDLSSLDEKDGFTINHEYFKQANGTFSVETSGSNARTTGDLNGDGIDDLAIGVPGATPDGIKNAGKVYVLWGERRLKE